MDGYPTGSVRISFGYMSKKEDADAFLKMIEEYFISKPTVKKIPPQFSLKRSLFSNENSKESCSDFYTQNIKNFVKSKAVNGTLESIYLYPIKSCGAFTVDTSWAIISTGLKYDRQWMIVNSSGVCVTQKHNRRLCLIKPIINLKKDILTLTYEGLYSAESLMKM